MDPQIIGVIQNLLVAVVIAIITVIGFAAKKAIVLAGVYLEQKLGLATYTFVKDYVATTVRFVEQTPIFKELTGPEKKAQVMNEVASWCKARNIPVDAALIEKMVEEAVQVMNSFKSPDASELLGVLSDAGNNAAYPLKTVVK
jgi:hypothetical protein